MSQSAFPQMFENETIPKGTEGGRERCAIWVVGGREQGASVICSTTDRQTQLLITSDFTEQQPPYKCRPVESLPAHTHQTETYAIMTNSTVGVNAASMLVVYL